MYTVLSLHKANKVCFDYLKASVAGRRKRRGKSQGSEAETTKNHDIISSAAAVSVGPLPERLPAAQSAASGCQNDEITERLIARRISSYWCEFFQFSKEHAAAMSDNSFLSRAHSYWYGKMILSSLR